MGASSPSPPSPPQTQIVQGGGQYANPAEAALASSLAATGQSLLGSYQGPFGGYGVRELMGQNPNYQGLQAPQFNPRVFSQFLQDRARVNPFGPPAGAGGGPFAGGAPQYGVPFGAPPAGPGLPAVGGGGGGGAPGGGGGGGGSGPVRPPENPAGPVKAPGMPSAPPPAAPQAPTMPAWTPASMKAPGGVPPGMSLGPGWQSAQDFSAGNPQVAGMLASGGVNWMPSAGAGGGKPEPAPRFGG